MRQIGDRPPVLGAPDFRILAEIADQNHLVHASRHRRSPLSKLLELSGAPAREPIVLHVRSADHRWGATLYAQRPRDRAIPRDLPVIHI